MAKETARYRNGSSSSLNGLNSGGEERYALRSLNAHWHSFVHSNDLLNMRKKGRHLSDVLETNVFNAAIFPFRLCTSLLVLGKANSIMASIFSGLTSIPF